MLFGVHQLSFGSPPGRGRESATPATGENDEHEGCRDRLRSTSGPLSAGVAHNTDCTISPQVHTTGASPAGPSPTGMYRFAKQEGCAGKPQEGQPHQTSSGPSADPTKQYLSSVPAPCCCKSISRSPWPKQDSTHKVRRRSPANRPAIRGPAPPAQMSARTPQSIDVAFSGGPKASTQQLVQTAFSLHHQPLRPASQL